MDEYIGPSGNVVYPIKNTGCFIDPEDGIFYDCYGRIIPFLPDENSIIDNQAINNYVSKLTELVINSKNTKQNYLKYNKLILKNIEDVKLLTNKNLCTIREIDFSDINNSLNYDPIKELFCSNKTLISLSCINLCNIKVDIDLLETIKNIDCDTEPFIREKPFLDNKHEIFTAPIKIYINNNIDFIHDVLKPCEKSNFIIYTGFPYEERLAHLKLYIKRS